MKPHLHCLVLAREVLPTTYAQQVAWLLAQLDPSTSRFSRVLRLQGHVDVEALRTAATALVERHSALRTAVFAAEAEPVQRVHPLGATPPFSLGTIGVGAGASDDEVLRAIDVVPTRELDVESGRAFTATLFALADDDHVLTLDAHACAADAASMDVLVGDFFELYEAAVSGREHRLPPAAAYTEHSERERRLLEEGGFEPHVEFWRAACPG